MLAIQMTTAITIPTTNNKHQTNKQHKVIMITAHHNTTRAQRIITACRQKDNDAGDENKSIRNDD